MTIWHELANAAPTEEQSFRIASLRWFLRFYQQLKPEVVAELRARVLPLFLNIMSTRGQQASSRELETYRKTLWGWIDDFWLPKSREMEEEAVLTLLFPSPSGQLIFAWDSIQEFLRSQKILKSRNILPFAFQAPGWILAEESIEEAGGRLEKCFTKILSEHKAAWRRRGPDLKVLEQDKKHIRDIRWLAYKQACPDLSIKDIANRDQSSPDTVRRGLQSAADCLDLPRVRIRQAPRGRKPRSRSSPSDI